MRMSSNGSYWCALALVASLASVNFLTDLAEPRGTVWDESYYLTSTERYAEGVAQFASHPPLGLMLIAAGDELLHPNRSIDTRPLGRDKHADGRVIPAGYSFAGVRLAPGLFAVLGAMTFFALMYAITQSTVTALVFSNLFTFENAFVTQFRAAQLDAFQIAFTAVALLCFVIAAKRQQRSSPALEAGLGAACGLAMMVKLNAVVLLLLGVMLILRRVSMGWAGTPRRRLLLIAIREASIIAGSCVLVMVAVFAVHLRVGTNYVDPTTVAGQKDQQFLSQQYREYLQGTRPLSPSVIVNAASDYLQFMAADFEGTPRSDANASTPLQWPLEHGTINYRWDSDGTRTAYVQLVGNRVNWILALAAPFAALALLILQWRRPGEPADRVRPAGVRRPLLVMLLIEYVAFMALHCFLGLFRVMYLYHYFIGLLLAFTLLPLVFLEAADRWPAVRKWQTPALAGLTALLLVSFVFYSPLNFHRPLTYQQCEWRNSFQHVVNCRS
ncbi:MAG: phospholipid carrier-dependent glycosyltransferase [Gammaproteobacteria bacterium]|nr:phospholipid carrier-dependent glycosyltransferase [Gammaproteobacteria bacterium]